MKKKYGSLLFWPQTKRYLKYVYSFFHSHILPRLFENISVKKRSLNSTSSLPPFPFLPTFRKNYASVFQNSFCNFAIISTVFFFFFCWKKFQSTFLICTLFILFTLRKISTWITKDGRSANIFIIKMCVLWKIIY